MKHIYSILILLSILFKGYGQDKCEVVGWASQNGGVTGGGSNTATTVSNYNDLKAAITDKNIKVVFIQGDILIPAGGRITMQDQSNKTLFGLPGSSLESTDLSASGSGVMYMKRCTNIIMRNIVFIGPGAYDTDGYDNFCVDNCQNIWVDHCEFHDGMDGNFDIKNLSDYISVTWCTFSYEKAPIAGGSGGSNDHRYTNLIGSSDGATGDEGKLKTTFQYCWWGAGCKERMPRIRYGQIHMVNNLFTSSVSNHNIRAAYKANVLVEGNYFDNQKLPIDLYDGTAIVTERNNTYVNCSGSSRGTAFTPPYTIEVANANDIVLPIQTCAGATLTTVDGCSSCTSSNLAPEITINSPSNNSSLSGPLNIEFTVSATDSDGSVSYVEFYNVSTIIGTSYSSPFNFVWNNVQEGTYSVYAVAIDNETKSGNSQTISITITDPNKAILTSNEDTIQIIAPNTTITPTVFTWGGAATDIQYTNLPQGLSAVKDINNKTLTISGTPTNSGSYSVSTIGGSSVVSIESSIVISTNIILANWYNFQENPISLDFLSNSDASIDVAYYDNTKPNNGVAYTTGALRLNKATGSFTITLNTISEFKFRMYATGGRTLQINYGQTGVENIWNSAGQYSSGGNEIDVIAEIPELINISPVVITIINDRTDGGTLNIHDLYIEGSKASPLITQTINFTQGWNLFSTNLILENNSFNTLFNQVDYSIIKSTDGFYGKNLTSEFNSIQALEPGVGYLIYCNNATSIDLTGSICNSQLPILKRGWNLVGCPFQTSTAFTNNFNSNNCELIKNNEGNWVPNASSGNTIENFEPGKAYMVLYK